MSQAHNLLEIWDIYSKQIIVEKAPGKKAEKMTTKPGPAPMNLNDPKVKGFTHKDTSGPGEAEGVQKNIIDPKTMTDAQKKQHAFEISKFTLAGENFDKNMEKSSKAVINNNMKSIFDKLFEEVMDKGEEAADLDALGIGADEVGVEDTVGEEITVTLSPEQVDCLKAILAQVEGGEDMGEVDETEVDMEMAPEGDEGMGEEDAEEKEEKHEEDAEEEKEEDMKEATEMKEVPDSAGKSLMNKNNKVGDKTAKLAKKGPGDKGKIPSPETGKDLPDSTGHAMTKISNNKPASKIKGNNQEFFSL